VKGLPNPHDALPDRLHRLLEGSLPEVPAGGQMPAGEQRHWSLTDIDQLLQDMRQPVSAEFLPPELTPEEPISIPEPVPEPKPVPEPELVPAPELAPAPLPEPTPEETRREPAISEIQAHELTEPTPKPLRFDLFQDREQITRVLRPKVPEQIEKPGVILRPGDMQATSDLSPVPKVLPAEELLVRQQHAPETNAIEQIPEGQQRFPDFDAEPARPSTEEELRAHAEKNRAERTTQFRTLRSLSEQMAQSGETGASAGDTEHTGKGSREATGDWDCSGGAVPSGRSGGPAAGGEATSFEYREAGQRDGVFQALHRARQRRFQTAMALGVLALLAAGLQALPLLARNVDTADPLYMGPMALFLAAGLLLCAGDFLSGLKALLRRRPSADSLLLAAALLCTAQAVVLFLPSLGGGSQCAPLFLFAAAGQAAARWQQARQNCDNFRCVAYHLGENRFALRLVNEPMAKTQRQTALPARSKTAVPVPVTFPADFMRRSLRENAVDQYAAWLFPLALGLALMGGLGAGLTQSPAAGLTAAAAALCLSVPAGALYILARHMRGLTKSPPENGVAILNTDAAEDCAQAGAYVLDSNDLYLPARGKMHGWREYWQVRTDEVLLYAAGMAIAAGGPLQAVFSGVVEGDYSVLPEVRELLYEDRMGLTCWIHNQKVFFGNRRLLENHGVAVALTEKEERAYEHDGRRILYLAMDKRLTAFFVVSYAPDPALAEPFQLLEKEDMEALICNSDPCVAAENLCAAFGLRDRSLAILRAAPTEAMRLKMRVPEARESAGVYFAGNARAFFKALTACAALRTGIRRLRLFQVIGTLTAFGLLLLAVLTRQLDSGANTLYLIAFEIIWAAIAYAMTKS